MSAALEKVAKEVGAKHMTAVAIAYVMQKTPHVFPIVGGRKVEHLESNLEALEIVLTPEHIKYLESIIPFDPGFPTTLIVSLFSSRHSLLSNAFTQGDGSEYMVLMAATAYMEKQPPLRAIAPDVS